MSHPINLRVYVGSYFNHYQSFAKKVSHLQKLGRPYVLCYLVIQTIGLKNSG